VTPDDDAYSRLAAACASYRERGYRLALDLREPLLADYRAAASKLGADWWRLHTRDALTLGARLAGEGVLLRGGASARGEAALQVQAERVLCEVASAAMPRFMF
jgi:hypothetical protein